jgi:hypothetical protein
LAQHGRDVGPLAVHERFATGDHDRARAEFGEVREQPRNGLRGDVPGTIAPVIAGDAARVAPVSQVQRHQRQRLDVRIRHSPWHPQGAHLIVGQDLK